MRSKNSAKAPFKSTFTVWVFQRSHHAATLVRDMKQYLGMLRSLRMGLLPCCFCAFYSIKLWISKALVCLCTKNPESVKVSKRIEWLGGQDRTKGKGPDQFDYRNLV